MLTIRYALTWVLLGLLRHVAVPPFVWNVPIGAKTASIGVKGDNNIWLVVIQLTRRISEAINRKRDADKKAEGQA